MIKIPLEEIISSIKERSGLSFEEIESRMDAKVKQLSGLISREGAAHIIANELGIRLFESVSGRLQIKNILSGMRDVETVGRVLRIFGISEFATESKTGRVASMIIGDETGQVRIVLWNEQADNVSQIKLGDIVKIRSGYVRERNGQLEVHLNQKSKLIINPSGESMPEIKEKAYSKNSERKFINELKEGDSAEVLGSIVQVFEPRFYESCPQCRRKLRETKDGLSCQTHGIMNPSFSYVLNLFLDDGTENIRVVCFREQAMQLLSKDDKDMLEFKNFPDKFEQVKQSVLGMQIKVYGKVVKNQNFDRIEFIAQSINPNPDPLKEMEILKSELAKK
ncbi:MAG: OB-fold nucleic acid binding domain-containing protein [Candidatus Woesearchaeota archaeon]|nr:OB-fold nucleic acid binding domain-containing protein [Candidatus Woesearchaeota archaeon]